VPERARDSQDEPDKPDERRSKAVPAIVEEQVETARAGVFRAYVRAREKARRLAAEGPAGADDLHGRAS
jgi:hypothetical protein